MTASLQASLTPPLGDDYPTGIFSSVFTGAEAFLADHIIQGKKILPGMAYLEIARSAVACATTMSDDYIIVLSDSVFVKALVVDEQCTLEVRVYPGAQGEFGVEVSSDQGVHFQTKAYLHSAAEQSPQRHFDLAALQQLCDLEGPSKQQFYSNFKKRAVDLGPSHRGIESIKLGEGCLLAEVSLPGSSRRGMAMDPGMLDSIIQSGVLLAENPEANVVPFAVKQTKIYGSLCDHMYVYVAKTRRGLDYTIADREGDIRVIIEGFATREIDLNAQQDQVVFYQPQWREEDISERNSDGENISIIRQQSSYSALIKNLCKTAQKLMRTKADQPLIEVQLRADQPAWRGVVAALKTIALEYPKIHSRLRLGDKLLRLDYAATELSATAHPRWPDNKTILITGGLGGIGMLLARDIAAHSQGCRLVLVGRRALDDSGQAFIQQLQALGASAHYVQCDISRAAEVNQLLGDYAQINGIIHAAGTLSDSLIGNKNLAEIDTVLAPKVAGLEYLDSASAALALDYFICFSSIAGALGNAGQIDYAAANGYMDAYMLQRAELVERGQRQGKSISINWPLWQSEGMQLDAATLQNLFQVFKIRPLPAAVGLQALKDIIASEQQQLAVLFGNKKSIATLFEKRSASKAAPGSAKPAGGNATPLTSDKLIREILQEIRIQAAEHLKLQVNQLDDSADWAEFGFDSILLSSFINTLNSRFGLDLMPTVLFEATNIQLFSRYLAENYREPMAKHLAVAGELAPQAKAEPAVHEPINISNFAQGFKKSFKSGSGYREKDIAIVGASCRIAGARNLQEFWQMLDQEKDMISEIPRDRWDWRDYPQCSKWGSFIDGVDQFDSLFFGISPAEAMYMAPEQRLIMQYVWECLEDAGCAGDDIRGTNTGVFVGCGPSGYSSVLSSMPVEAYSATGFVPSVGPNRISYLMDWHGPSNPIETACSSALVAVHRAVEAIRAGHCEQAIAGGVSLLLAPDGYISFSKAGMLAEDGKCKTFSDQANGYVRGEGVGMLLLKPLQAALEGGNHIYAVVKGTAENHGGRTNSLTAPNPKSQAAVIKKAVADAELDFSRVSYIECHGTGTELGDPVEIKGLKTVAADLLDGRQSSHSCKLGSIKSNIGHLEYAAGVVGLIKVILQMQHKKIARSLHCARINPYIDLTGTPFAVAQTASEWLVPEGQTRVAGVSSFGFGGVNAHIVLEEFRADANVDSETSAADGAQLLLLSARTEESLLDYATQFSRFIKNSPQSYAVLRRMAYTLQTGRAEMQERVAFVAKSCQEWSEQLDSFVANKGKANNRKVCRGKVSGSAAGNLEIADTAAGREYIKQLMLAGESEKLAELWVKGSKIDWQLLYC